jgi:DNA-binding response OmpR family regulator
MPPTQKYMSNDSAIPSAFILLVEGDVVLRELIAEIALEEGYESLQAGNAEEAFAVLNMRYHVDILLADIGMPGDFDGLEVASRVRDYSALTKIILTSGSPPSRFDNLPAGSIFLQKPFLTSTLIKALRVPGRSD